MKEIRLEDVRIIDGERISLLAAQGIRSVQQLYALLAAKGVGVEIQRLLGLTDDALENLKESLEKLLSADEIGRLSKYTDHSGRLGALIRRSRDCGNAELSDGKG